MNKRHGRGGRFARRPWWSYVPGGLWLLASAGAALALYAARPA